MSAQVMHHTCIRSILSVALMCQFSGLCLLTGCADPGAEDQAESEIIRPHSSIPEPGGRSERAARMIEEAKAFSALDPAKFRKYTIAVHVEQSQGAASVLDFQFYVDRYGNAGFSALHTIDLPTLSGHELKQIINASGNRYHIWFSEVTVRDLNNHGAGARGLSQDEQKALLGAIGY